MCSLHLSIFVICVINDMFSVMNEIKLCGRESVIRRKTSLFSHCYEASELLRIVMTPGHFSYLWCTSTWGNWKKALFKQMVSMPTRVDLRGTQNI